jgi:3',5'-cyclic AMP phosphodiesterase CpdA
MRGAASGALRVFALHHGLLPVPGRKLRDGDLSHRSGDVLALLSDLDVDLALHGHIHRANAWQLSDGRGAIVVASAGALINDGRRDASYLEVVAERGRLAVWRRSVATGRSTLLYEGGLAAHR